VDNLTNPSEPSRGDADGQSRSDGRSRSVGRSVAGLIRRHRAVAVATAVLLCGMVTAPVVAVALSGQPRRAVVTTATGTSPTTDPPPASTVPSTTSTTAAPPTTTAVAVQQPAPTTTATTALVCHNSYNPACGPFRWAPAPVPTDQASVSISYSPADPVAGGQVTFTVRISDPDTTVSTCGQVEYGDGMGQGCAAGTAPMCPIRYGPWDLPAKHATSATATYPYTYAAAGTYTVKVRYPTGNPCYDPYQSQVTGTDTVVVGAAGNPSTTS